LRRSQRITDPERTLVVVRDEHRHWWQRELQDLPNENVLSEAVNRGTAVAILNALIHVLQRDSNPVLLFLPSDHSADHEDALVESASSAARLAAASREHLVLLGITPDRPETEYGWILPGGDDSGGGRIVERFVEKPQAGLALGLHASGALWNSFIFASSAHLLLDLFQATQPRLVSGYLKWFRGQESSALRARDQFLALPSTDFSQDVLQSAAYCLRVLVVPPCGWTDLGTPRRVNEWLERVRVFPSTASDPLMRGQPVTGMKIATTTQWSMKEALQCQSQSQN
jgi:mannose-1-phosphate guanylyltransferase